MNINIRQAKESDLDFLSYLEKNVFPAYQQNSKVNIKKALTSTFQQVLIVENNNIQIGSAVLFRYKNTLRIYSIGVITEYQGKGIGGKILDYIKQLALDNNFQTLSLEASARNQKLVQWYLYNGFRQIKMLIDYYSTGEDAVKMEMKITNSALSKNVIVIDQPFNWERHDVNAKIITVKEYINNTEYQNNSDFRIFNLCSSYKYQSYGYYVSLLASARGQRVIPDISTIRDFRIINVIQSVAYDVDELINNLLNKTVATSFSLNVYFGQTPDKKYNSLAKKLYQIFEAPLFRVTFVKNEKWLIKNIKVISFKNIVDQEKELMYEFAANYFNKKRHNFPKLKNYKYDVAVLVNPNEENPPSDSEALEKLKNAAARKNIYLELITKSDINKIHEFDALFIRETTNVSHHTYEISRFAYAEGLVVIDDPWSILRCSNKIYQNELFRKNKISTPKTISLTKNLFNVKQLDGFTYPIVLKQPDSAFSLGVIKVDNKEEAKEELTKLFKKSDMVICQEFLYSEYDWRIGVLDNKPIFACKYYMTKNHWQIYDWSGSEGEIVGKHEAVAVEEVPENVLKVAQKAASLIGDGLYGVDLKMVNNKVYVVEVNDNPNIDADVEDVVLKDKLYDILIESIVNRIEIAKNIRKINLTDNENKI